MIDYTPPDFDAIPRACRRLLVATGTGTLVELDDVMVLRDLEGGQIHAFGTKTGELLVSVPSSAAVIHWV